MRSAADEPIRFLLPGPSYVLERVRAAQNRPLIGHRSPTFKELHAGLAARLPELFRTKREVVIATGSATLLMESAVRSTVETGRGRVLSLTCGAFSERWHGISRACGVDAERLAVPWGEAIDPDAVRQRLRRGSYDAVTLVHNETSTGVLNPLRALARAVREESDALLLVDTVSSLGGARVETDEWDLDLVLTGSQKALALPPGLAFCSFSERAAERMNRVPCRGFYTDLLLYRDKHRQSLTPTTPAISLLFALDLQLGNILSEGVEQRWRRHDELQAQLASWASERGFGFASALGARSPTVSCLSPPDGVSAPGLVAALAAEGFTVGSGYGDWKPTTFRIGHMGEVRSDDLEALLATIDRLIQRSVD